MKWFPVLVIFTCAFTLLQSINAEEPNAKSIDESVTTLKDVHYVENGTSRQTLDLYLPKGDEVKPLVIWIHGGAFRFGSKALPFPASRMLSKGFAVASLNYRLTNTVKFPEPVQDCKAAVRWLRAHAAEHHLDTDHFGVWGASAGGYFATMLGVTSQGGQFDAGENLEYSSAVQCVIDEYGPTDFTMMDIQDKDLPGNMNHDAADSPESRLLGGPVQENKDKAAAASPITYVTSESAPILIIHGDQDNLVPYEQSLLLTKALEKAKVPFTLHTVKNGGHGSGFSEADHLAAEDFLIAHLKKKPQP